MAAISASLTARAAAFRSPCAQAAIDLPILGPFARGPGAKAKFEAAIRACTPLTRPGMLSPARLDDEHTAVDEAARRIGSAKRRNVNGPCELIACFTL